MSLVDAKESLLFYDRLSVEKFPSDKELYLEHSERMVSDLRNLLEARSLSIRDDDERIRLIIVLDLTDGIFQPSDGQVFFPAQKVRAVKDLVVRVFGDKNPLLGRMEYAFIFINNDDEKPLASLLQGFNAAHIGLNACRDELIKQMGSPDDDLELSDERVSATWGRFNEEVVAVKEHLGPKLAEAAVKEAFEHSLEEAFAWVKTVGDFEVFDFDGAVHTCINRLVGLNADESFGDCVFFILKFDESPAAVKQRDELFVKSLVQLLCTIGSNDYDRYFKSSGVLKNARLFVLSEYGNTNIDADALVALGNQVRSCLPKLNDAKWTEDMDVEYREFSSSISEPIKADTHRGLNAKNIRKRSSLMEDFIGVRQIPFFFDKKKDGWSWYHDVMDCVTSLYDFEKVNDRPLYDTPKRITGKEMCIETRKTTYRELEDAQNKLSKQEIQVMHVEDLNGYMAKRHDMMRRFAGAIDELREEMPKLGYLSYLLWIGILSLVGFILCFSFHFWHGGSGSLYTMAIALVAVGLLSVLASLIGQSSVKRRISRIYDKIDDICRQLQENLDKYLDDVNKRARLQQEADVRRRNLDEMEEKLEEFTSHNKRVDLWKTHFTSIADKLDYILATLGKDYGEPAEKLKLNVDDFSLEGFPTLPLLIRSKYQAMHTQIMQVPVDIDAVTCFVKYFRFTEVNPD